MSTTPRHPDGGDLDPPSGDILEEIKAEIEHDLEEERPPHAGPTTQVVAALVALAIGVFGIVQSLGYGLGEATQPGPGLWPFIVSLVITCWPSCCSRSGGTPRTPNSSPGPACSPRSGS